MPTALITGIGGQDGSYLAEHLLELGYKVHGIIRRASVTENQDSRVRHLEGIAQFHYGDLLDVFSLQRIFREVQPDEVYNLAAQSHVRISFDVPSFTIQTNALGVLNVLEVFRQTCPSARFYQASSSEMFGISIDPDGCQRETTPMLPASPYGCAKVLGYNLVRHYRIAYKLFAANGILFNHESPRRGSNFVTRKVVKGAVEIKLGRRTKLRMGNLDAQRDWGHSADYVQAMRLILAHNHPDDFVIATGETHSVREMCDHVFGILGMDYREHVEQDPRLMRPEEVPRLRGDATKARTVLGWKPKYTFASLLDEMVESEMRTKG
jgi:GDPmannose 4,6-dehydratase